MELIAHLPIPCLGKGLLAFLVSKEQSLVHLSPSVRSEMSI